ncbi:hypothetical protein [Streptomyces sp. MS2.AVA.5]|uniref:Uncharacterized protein n=1 Tax=Streptomyces achmelvichensis TaxID=3134111 RepID=A0ACC6PM32_9ACTN
MQEMPAGDLLIDPARLGGLVEAAEVMGLTKQAAARALKSQNAPGAVCILAMGPVYDLSEIAAWNAVRRRRPGPAPRNATLHAPSLSLSARPR